MPSSDPSEAEAGASLDLGSRESASDPARSLQLARTRLLGRRAGLGVLLVSAFVFIGASSWQIIRAVFGLEPPGGGASGLAAAGSAQRECGQGIQALALAVDRASSRAWERAGDAAPGADGPTLSAFELGLDPEWADSARVEEACASSDHGREGFAALLRFRRGAEQLLRGDRIELVPLRRDVAAHLASELR